MGNPTEAQSPLLFVSSATPEADQLVSASKAAGPKAPNSGRLSVPLKSPYMLPAKHRSKWVNYCDHPMFKLITGSILCSAGVDERLSKVVKHKPVPEKPE